MLSVKEAFPSAILGSQVVTDSSVHLGADGGRGLILPIRGVPEKLIPVTLTGLVGM